MPTLLAQTPVLTLDSCLNSALQRNCTIRTAQIDVLIAREVKKQMLWKYFPQVSIEALGYAAARPLVETDVTEIGQDQSTSDFLKDAFSLLDEIAKVEDSTAQVSSTVEMFKWGVAAQVRAMQPVFWGGQIVNANRLAKLGIDAAELKQEMSERDVLQEVTETYWLVAGLMEKRATVRKVTELLDSISDVAHTAFNHGLVTRNDLLRVQLKQNEMQSKHLQLENGIQLASRLLCIMTGLPYEQELLLQPIPTDETLTELAAEPESFTISGRPEFKLLDVNVRYNELMRKLTLGETLPHLYIGATGGYSNFMEKDKGNIIGFFNLSIPLTGWGETAHKLKQHSYMIEQAELMRSHYHEKLALQNRQVYDQLIESLKLVEQNRTGRDLADENYRVAMLNYTAGVATMTELLESEALLLQAENAYTDARISYQTAKRRFEDLNK